MNAIEVENLSKKYIIGHQANKSPKTLREVLTVLPRQKRKLIDGTPKEEIFWALKNISFTVGAGERLAIIGANGAGKSTLLKILSRITEPTEGKVRIRGKVSSLLEVGTGFHHELTGRENIFLNGAILGMKQKEIIAKFDQIVAFSGIEKFIDTPVKHYSSGMYVRLAFSVSAWLDPDILIVDEVLSVGDYAFQRRCSDRMKELTGAGRTVLFVSHSMQAVKAMCDKAIILKDGLISFNGSVDNAVEEYKRIIDAEDSYSFKIDDLCINNCSSRGGIGGIRVRKLSINNESFNDTPATKIPEIEFGGSLSVEILFHVDEIDVSNEIDLAFAIDSKNGQRIYTTISSWENKRYSTANNHERHILATLIINKVFLHAGDYRVSIALIRNGVTHDVLVDAAGFRISGNEMQQGVPFTEDFGLARFPSTFNEA